MHRITQKDCRSGWSEAEYRPSSMQRKASFFHSPSSSLLFPDLPFNSLSLSASAPSSLSPTTDQSDGLQSPSDHPLTTDRSTPHLQPPDRNYPSHTRLPCNTPALEPYPTTSSPPARGCCIFLEKRGGMWSFLRPPFSVLRPAGHSLWLWSG